ncbi:MAG TPA: SUF system NifU family Fe-S cluster assembly protein, partial [Rhodospirillaceae bacterium]|nr:SUF system NifU family Fe-S cluster assembly protein [Rhodospirillaceae bacterium]
ELYQEVILEHGKNPRNFYASEDATNEARGNNPLCGDQLVIYLKLDDDGRVANASFLGKGCAISMASASMMTEIVKGRTRNEAESIFEAFHGICTGEEAGHKLSDDLEKLQVLSGVSAFPTRVKCATLPWHTMVAALHGKDEISTE